MHGAAGAAVLCGVFGRFDQLSGLVRCYGSVTFVALTKAAYGACTVVGGAQGQDRCAVGHMRLLVCGTVQQEVASLVDPKVSSSSCMSHCDMPNQHIHLLVVQHTHQMKVQKRLSMCLFGLAMQQASFCAAAYVCVFFGS
jgi:hypothetical protein